MYVNEGLGVVPGVGDLTSPIMAIASLFQGKPSDFRVWLYFDNHGHYVRQVGDKPNANTVGMANAIVQAWTQYIAQLEASGASYNLPSSFVVNIGQRDPSFFYMPDTPHGDPAHGGGTNAKTQLAGPGDPNGTIQGMINFMKQYMQGTPSQPTQPATGGSVVTSPASSLMPSPAITAPAIASPLVSYGPTGVPQASYTGAPLTYEPATPISSPGYVPGYTQPTQAGMLSSLGGNLPTMLIIGGVGILAIAMMGGQSAPRTRTRVVYRRPRRASRR